MGEPLFVSKAEVLAIHEEQIASTGGCLGLRDEALLESALSSPQNVYCFDEESDIFDLASAYVFSIVRDHPFVDGNKRTATETAVNFLKINGLPIEVEPLQFSSVVSDLAIYSVDKTFIAKFLFLGCLKELIDTDCRYEIDPPPQSFLNAQTKEERNAILTDYSTSKTRVALIESCLKHMIRPDRFDRGLDRVENLLFKNVTLEWRVQFGMACDEDPKIELQ